MCHPWPRSIQVARGKLPLRRRSGANGGAGPTRAGREAPTIVYGGRSGLPARCPYFVRTDRRCDVRFRPVAAARDCPLLDRLVFSRLFRALQLLNKPIAALLQPD